MDKPGHKEKELEKFSSSASDECPFHLGLTICEASSFACTENMLHFSPWIGKLKQKWVSKGEAKASEV